MQLLCNHSEEGNVDGLGIFNTAVKKFNVLKVPQIGWNKVRGLSRPLFEGMRSDPYCYFVHSYYAELCIETTAMTEYGIEYSSALQKDNFYGVQFHPEKSAEAGELVLQNFLSL
jgi:glutamine amidotransferase